MEATLDALKKHPESTYGLLAQQQKAAKAKAPAIVPKPVKLESPKPLKAIRISKVQKQPAKVAAEAPVQQ